ncbi:sigma-70 family RNA polymerase sigma factor [Agarilytica rhodophyticola]|uniref:sigma-70 family RNA polymerase sigma factor n=1 Tax=Agarilytica rhodophyticola TaxID=1737490 RepID=UPI000B346055|nr:sigma-70 family RNA polymerase sigma factor [Agarilytica rhodophyticola]
MAVQKEQSQQKRMDTQKAREDSWSTLLTRIAQHHDEHAFAELFQHFAPLIKGFCQSNITYLSSEAADELVQEVMFKVWQKSANFDSSKASASTWIFTITRNARIDYLRKNSKHQLLSQPLETDDIWDEAADNQPFIYLQQNRQQQEIVSFLESLPKEQRSCIRKVYMEGKSHTEIADELKLPLGTVKSRVRLGLKKLQAHPQVLSR